MLELTCLGVEEIATKIGNEDLKNFRRVFKRIVGLCRLRITVGGSRVGMKATRCASVSRRQLIGRRSFGIHRDLQRPDEVAVGGKH